MRHGREAGTFLESCLTPLMVMSLLQTFATPTQTGSPSVITWSHTDGGMKFMLIEVSYYLDPLEVMT